MKSDLLSSDRSALVIIDVQERLFPHIHDRERVLSRIDLLILAAGQLKVPVLLTEQYPKGLGGTIEAIRKALPGNTPLTKIDFSCVPAPGFGDRLNSLERDQIVLSGIETHVCVAQTAIDLAAQGKEVFVLADATGSRRPLDAKIALRRLDRCGVIVTTAESVVFEWLRRAGTDAFKALQPKLKTLI